MDYVLNKLLLSCYLVLIFIKKEGEKVVNIEYWSITKKGKDHDRNEDSSLNISKINVFNMALFMVCDGVGGYAGGDIASKMIISKFEAQFQEMREQCKNIELCIKQMLRDINKDILKYSSENPEYPKLSSTVVGLLINNEDYHVFSIGDSRIYLRDKVGFRQINEDDSRVWKRFKDGLIKKSEIINQNDKNLITAAIGFREEIEPHYYTGKLKEYFQFILCSDGLTDFVTEGDIEKLLSEDKSIRERCIGLVNNAVMNNSNDDITVSIIEGELEINKSLK
jgi:protein phosphatase